MKMVKTALVLAVLLFFGCGKKGVELKFRYAEGQKVKYRLLSEINTRTSTNDVSNTHTIKLDILASYTINKILKNGDAELVFSYEKIGYLNTQNPEKAEEIVALLKDQNLRLTVSPYGDLVSASGFKGIPQLYADDFDILTLLFKAHPIFPRQPVEIGRKWDRQQEYPVENGLVKGNMMVYKRFSILDTLSRDGYPAAKIASEITMKFSIPDNDRFTIKQDGADRLGLFGKGVIHFDLAKGVVAYTNAAIFGKMVVVLKHPVTGDPIQTRIEIAQNITMSREE